MPTLWEWISELVIPAVVGIASVLVAVAAVRTSRDAMRLARDAESSRRRDEERMLLRSDAQDQARLLTSWVDADSKKSPYVVSRRISDPEPPETPLQRLRRESIATLSVSHVPGAEEILAMTQHDLESARRTPPPNAHEQYVAKWRDRTLRRIRDWGLNPLLTSELVRDEMFQARQEPDDYARLPLGVGWENAYDQPEGGDE